MNGLDKLAYVLVIVGGLNWGLIGFFEYSLVDEIFNNGVSRTIYAIVGLAALYLFVKMLQMMNEPKKGH